MQKKLLPSLLSTLFLTIIFLPLLASMFKFGPNSGIQENRNLKAKPKLSFNNLKTFPAEYQKFYDDTFPFRSWLIQTKNFINIKILKSSPRSDIIIGKNGWFFFNGEGPLQKEKTFTESELELIKNNLEETEIYLANKGIKLYVLVTPNAQTIYKEHVPEYLQYGNNTRTDQVAEILVDTRVKFIDPRVKLTSNKQLQSYRKYDTHWNEYGAFLTYQDLLSTISEDFTYVNPKTIQDFEITQEKSRSNDLLNMLAMEGQFEESIPTLKPKTTPLATQTILSCRFRPNCEKIRTTVDNSSLPTLLMYRDSFSNRLLPFISEHFSEATYLWTHKMTIKDLEEYKPDIIIFQVVERDVERLKNINLSLEK